MNKISSKDTKAKSVRQQSIGWLLTALSNSLDEDMNQALKAHGLNLHTFAILMTLLETDGLSQSEIGSRISMQGYTTTRNIDVLEEYGLLKRHKSKESRRSYSIRLTQKGKSLAPTLFKIVKDINEKAFLSFDKNEVVKLKQLLSKALLYKNKI